MYAGARNVSLKANLSDIMSKISKFAEPLYTALNLLEEKHNTNFRGSVAVKQGLQLTKNTLLANIKASENQTGNFSKLSKHEAESYAYQFRLLKQRFHYSDSIKDTQLKKKPNNPNKNNTNPNGIFEKNCKSCGVKIRHKPLIERGLKATFGSIAGFFSGAFFGTLAAPGVGTISGAVVGAAGGLATGDKSPDTCQLCCERCNMKKKDCPCDFTVPADYMNIYSDI